MGMIGVTVIRKGRQEESFKSFSILIESDPKFVQDYLRLLVGFSADTPGIYVGIINI